MTTSLSVTSLIVAQTKERILDVILGVARIAGLPVDTWRVGDPTRTQFVALAEMTEQRDLVQVELAKSAFLDTAEGDWLTLRAADVYGVEREEAVAATATVVVDNAEGGFFEIEPAGLVFLNSTTGQTFQNQATVTINPLTSGIAVSVVAQTAGAAGTSAANDIDTIVSPALQGVTVASSTAAIGSDEQSDPGLREQCRATLGALSPDGPADAYEFVARNAELTGIEGVTRAAADGDNTTGSVTVYVGTTTAGLDAPSVAAVQAALNEWAEPLCTIATAVSATPVTQAVTINLTPNHPEAQTAIEDALDEYFASVPTSSSAEPSTLARSAITAVAHRTLADALAIPLFSVTVDVTTPATDVTFDPGEFPVRGVLTLT